MVNLAEAIGDNQFVSKLLYIALKAAKGKIVETLAKFGLYIRFVRTEIRFMR